MNSFLDLTSLIFLVIAIVIFWRLRSVLGTRTGHEKPPSDPFAPPEKPTPTEGGDNVIQLPRAARNAEGEAAVIERIDALAPAGSPLNASLKAIAAADAAFDPEAFVSGAKAAYEMIVTAYAGGERDTLRSLLSREVFDGFSGAIADRERRGETVDFTFVGIDRAEIADAALKGGTAEITVRFAAQLISVTRAKSGEVVDGDPSKVSEATDVWTFARQLRSSDPNWALVATEVES